MQEQEIVDINQQSNEDAQSDFVKEIPNMADILKYSFFEESTAVFNGINNVISMLENVLTECKTKTDMLRILNTALNNFMLINEIIVRNAREQNLIPDLTDDANIPLEDDEEDNVLIRDHREDQENTDNV